MMTAPAIVIGAAERRFGLRGLRGRLELQLQFQRRRMERGKNMRGC